jgi:O-antigen/teichoic acid export membrane protein
VGGQYAMANRLVWGPIVLLSSSFAQVYYHKIGRLDDIATIRVFEKVSIKILAVGLIAVLMSFFLVDLFHLFLGYEWRMASELLPIQLLWGFFFLLSTPFRVMARAAKMQKLLILIDVVFIIVILVYSVLTEVGVFSLMVFVLIAAFLQHASISYYVNKKITKR